MNDTVINLGKITITLNQLITQLRREGYLVSIERHAPEWGSKWVDTEGEAIVLVVRVHEDRVYLVAERWHDTFSYNKEYFFQRFKPLDN